MVCLPGSCPCVQGPGSACDPVYHTDCREAALLAIWPPLLRWQPFCLSLSIPEKLRSKMIPAWAETVDTWEQTLQLFVPLAHYPGLTWRPRKC